MRDYAVYSPVIFLFSWLAIAIGWGLSTYFLLRENKKILGDIPTLPTLHYFLERINRLQQRMLQLWGVMGVLFLALSALFFFTLQGRNAPTQVTTEPPKAVSPKPSPAPEPVPTVLHTSPPAQTASAAPSASLPATNALPYSAITEFDEQDSKQQAQLDWLKQRYENWLITYYYLEKCHLAGKDDREFIRQSLHKELQDIKVDTSHMEENILLAASGSYNELYASVSCGDERLKATKAAYDAYMKNFQPSSAVNKASSTPKDTSHAGKP